MSTATATATGFCSGCGTTFKGARGLTAHQTGRFVAMGCLPKSTETVFVKIGWTRSDMANGYSSFGGYQPGASQHEEAFFLSVPAGTTAEQVADAAFTATNAPFITEGSMAARILTKIQEAGYRGQTAHYSLSTGDTVTVGETMLACESLGWKEISS